MEGRGGWVGGVGWREAGEGEGVGGHGVGDLGEGVSGG